MDIRRFQREREIIGQLVVGYSEMEFDLCRCIATANDDFNSTLKAFYKQRSEGKRLDYAENEGKKVYNILGGKFTEVVELIEGRKLTEGDRLTEAFHEAICAMRFCLHIRNRYAHWQFYDDDSGMLALVNLEDLAKAQTVIQKFSLQTVKDFSKHLTNEILEKQQIYFLYTRGCIDYVNNEGRYLRNKLSKGVSVERTFGGSRPAKLKRPPAEYAAPDQPHRPAGIIEDPDPSKPKP